MNLILDLLCPQIHSEHLVSAAQLLLSIQKRPCAVTRVETAYVSIPSKITTTVDNLKFLV